MDKVISCIVLAAGAGRRMAYKENKIFIPLGRYSIIQRTLQNVANLQGLSEIILVVADGEQDYMAEHIKVLNLTVPVHIVLGGAERQDSVACGLKAVDKSSNIVLVHDGARPLASTEIFSAVAEAANTYGVRDDKLRLVVAPTTAKPIKNANVPTKAGITTSNTSYPND